MNRLKNTLMSLTMPVLPKNHLSFAVGHLARWRGPEALTRWSVRQFAKAYGLNMAEAEHPLEHYQTIGELFTRRLKPGARPMGGGLVHPVDAELTQAGVVELGSLVQAKGKSYQLTEFLQHEELARRVDGGSYFTYYLCPTDYHRVHAPTSARLRSVQSIPGHLWPVNSWSVSHVHNLFSVNERVVMELETAQGLVVVVMIGATNVGQIRLSFDADFVTNQFGSQPLARRQYDPGLEIEKGQELGLFAMGSSVVVLYEKSYGHLAAGAQVPKKVRLGESLKSPSEPKSQPSKAQG